MDETHGRWARKCEQTVDDGSSDKDTQCRIAAEERGINKKVQEALTPEIESSGCDALGVNRGRCKVMKRSQDTHRQRRGDLSMFTSVWQRLSNESHARSSTSQGSQRAHDQEVR